MTDATSPLGADRRPASSTDEIKRSAHDASESAKTAASDAKAKLGAKGDEKIDAASTSAGESLRVVADQLRQAGEGLPPDQGWAKQAFTHGAQGLEQASSYLREGRLGTFARDLQGFARSNPAAFLAGSVALGFLAARVTKTAAEYAGAESGARPTGSATPTAAPRAPASTTYEPRSFAPPNEGLTTRTGEGF